MDKEVKHPKVNAEEIIDLILSDCNLTEVKISLIDKDILKFNEQCNNFNLKSLNLPEEPNDINEYHQKYSNVWIFPEKYHNINIKQYLLDKCKTQIELDRVNFEYKLFDDRNLINLLKALVYLVDVMRENNFIWGVGRGSSVSSYILYLIGIHKVDSIKYNLDIYEFLK